MKHKREKKGGIIMVWKYEKFMGDGAIYAFCPKCGFHHSPSRRDSETMEASIVYQYHYCPVCGEYLYDDNLKKDGVSVTWNERDVTELWEMEQGGLTYEISKGRTRILY